MRVLFILRDLAANDPSELMQLGSVLRFAGHEVRLADATRTPLLPLFATYRPGLVGSTLFTGERRALLRLNAAQKPATPLRRGCWWPARHLLPRGGGLA